MITLLGNSDYVAERRVNCESLLSFDGANQYADAGANRNAQNAINTDRSFTISAFVFHQIGERYKVISTVRNNKGWAFFFDHGKLGFDINGSSGSKGMRAAHDILPGRLAYVAVRFDLPSDTFTFFINGIKSGSFTGIKQLGTITFTNDKLYLGAQPNLGVKAWYKGGLNHVSFFNRTLTESEICYIDRHGPPPESSYRNIVAHYVPGRSGLVIRDLVEQYNHTKDTDIRYQATTSVDNYLLSNEFVAQGVKGEFSIVNVTGRNNSGDNFVFGITATTTGNTWINRQVAFNVNASSGSLQIMRSNSQYQTSVPYIKGATLRIVKEGTMAYMYQNEELVATEIITDQTYYAKYGVSGAINASAGNMAINRRVITPQIAHNMTIQTVKPGSLVPLQAYPATLHNFTDEEVGIPNQSTNTAYLDFHTKTPINQ